MPKYLSRNDNNIYNPNRFWTNGVCMRWSGYRGHRKLHYPVGSLYGTRELPKTQESATRNHIRYCNNLRHVSFV